MQRSIAILAPLLLLGGCVLPRSASVTSHSGNDELVRQLSLARLSERHDQLAEAAAIYRRVLANDPDNVTAHHRLGVMAARMGSYNKAMSHLQQAKAVQPDDAQLMSDIGYVHYLAGDLENAEKAIVQALQLDEGNLQARNNLGLVLGRQGRDRESLAAFRQVSGPAAALANLAYVRAQRGDLNNAMDYYHRSLDLNPELKVAAEALVEIDTHRDRLVRSSSRSPASRMAQKTGRQPQTRDDGFDIYPVRDESVAMAPLVASAALHAINEPTLLSRPKVRSKLVCEVAIDDVARTPSISPPQQHLEVTPNANALVTLKTEPPAQLPAIVPAEPIDAVNAVDTAEPVVSLVERGEPSGKSSRRRKAADEVRLVSHEVGQ